MVSLSLFMLTISLNSQQAHPFLRSLSIFIIIILNSVSGRLLASTSFSFFLGISLILSFEACFFVSIFWLHLCFCFCILCRSALSPNLGMVFLRGRCSVGLSSTVSLIIWAWCSTNVHCVGYVSPSIVVESWLLLIYSCMGSTLRLAD